jgi:hypothetical protein
MEQKQEDKTIEKLEKAEKKLPLIIELDQPQLDDVVGGSAGARRCPPGVIVEF